VFPPKDRTFPPPVCHLLGLDKGEGRGASCLPGKAFPRVPPPHRIPPHYRRRQAKHRGRAAAAGAVVPLPAYLSLRAEAIPADERSGAAQAYRSRVRQLTAADHPTGVPPATAAFCFDGPCSPKTSTYCSFDQNSFLKNGLRG